MRSEEGFVGYEADDADSSSMHPSLRSLSPLLLGRGITPKYNHRPRHFPRGSKGSSPHFRSRLHHSHQPIFPPRNSIVRTLPFTHMFVAISIVSDGVGRTVGVGRSNRIRGGSGRHPRQMPHPTPQGHGGRTQNRGYRRGTRSRRDFEYFPLNVGGRHGRVVECQRSREEVREVGCSIIITVVWKIWREMIDVVF